MFPCKLIGEGGTHTEQYLYTLKMDFPAQKTSLQAVLSLLWQRDSLPSDSPCHLAMPIQTSLDSPTENASGKGHTGQLTLPSCGTLSLWAMEGAGLPRQPLWDQVWKGILPSLICMCLMNSSEIPLPCTASSQRHSISWPLWFPQSH